MALLEKIRWRIPKKGSTG